LIDGVPQGCGFTGPSQIVVAVFAVVAEFVVAVVNFGVEALSR
jgi:hypothetical protein